MQKGIPEVDAGILKVSPRLIPWPLWSQRKRFKPFQSFLNMCSPNQSFATRPLTALECPVQRSEEWCSKACVFICGNNLSFSNLLGDAANLKAVSKSSAVFVNISLGVTREFRDMYIYIYII